MNSLKLNNAAKLSRNELKNITGGMQEAGPLACPLQCVYESFGGGDGCRPDQECRLWRCSSTQYGTRCVAS